MSKDVIKYLAREAILMPQEQLAAIGNQKQSLTIGIPKETSFQENRVALVPDSVLLLTNNGHQVVVESKAGENANFSDHAYSEAGAKISYDTKEVFEADIILKVAPPSVDEIDMMTGNQTLISALQLSVHPKNTLQKLMKKKITAVAWDFIKDEDDIFPIVRSMGEIAGNTAILMAAELLSNLNGGRGIMLGGIAGIAPAEVVILGAGTVGEYATRSAMAMGASVKVFDNSVSKLRRLQNNLGMRICTSIIQPKLLIKSLKRADVVIGAIRSPYGRTPVIITETMVKNMKEGSVIIDISIDQGGCVETSRATSHTNPTYKEHGVIHYCVPNIASRVSRTASYTLSNIFAPLMLKIAAKKGIKDLIRQDKGTRHGIYMMNGILTNANLGEAFGLPYKEIELLIAGI